MFQLTISGDTPDALKANVAAWLGTASAVAIVAATKDDGPLTGAEQARLRGDATVVAPKPPTAAEKKAAEKAAKEAAKKAAEEEAARKAAEAKAEGEADAEDETDPLDEDGEDESGEETLTHDNVKKLLVDVRGANPKDPSIVSKLVSEHGKAKKLSDVDAKHLPALAAACRALLK